MSTATVTVRYDGPALADHKMDVADIAPALIGLSELCKIANQKFNGDKSAVKVLIGTDVEHQCFEFKLLVVQTIWDTTKRLLTNEDVGSAKELLEWIGLIGGPAAGLFAVLKWLSGRKITSSEMEMKDGRDVVRITVEGDNNTVLYVPPQTLGLLRDEKAVANAKKVVQPLTRSGYDKLEFESHQGLKEKISSNDAAAITSLPGDGLEVSRIDQPQVIAAWVSVYSPVYDMKAPMWRFKFGDVHEYMDISATTIAADAIERGGAMVDDAYYVRLEIRQEHKGNGITNHYKILDVLDFKAARLPRQHDAFKSND